MTLTVFPALGVVPTGGSALSTFAFERVPEVTITRASLYPLRSSTALASSTLMPMMFGIGTLGPLEGAPLEPGLGAGVALAPAATTTSIAVPWLTRENAPGVWLSTVPGGLSGMSACATLPTDNPTAASA